MASTTTAVVTAIRRMSKKHHAHGCKGCGLRYTDACSVPEVNDLCPACRDRERPLWDRNYDMRACCVDSVLVREVQALSRYGLAGPGPWYRCRECARTHPFNPKERHV